MAQTAGRAVNRAEQAETVTCYPLVHETRHDDGPMDIQAHTPPVNASQTHNLSSQMIVGYVIHNGESFRFHIIIMTSLEEIHTHTLHRACGNTPHIVSTHSNRAQFQGQYWINI